MEKSRSSETRGTDVVNQGHRIAALENDLLEQHVVAE